jgi:hypothetical protein
MPGGRPTDYSEQTLVDAQYYLDNYKDFDDVIPQIASLALHLGVRRETLWAWDQDPEKEEFSNIFESVKAKQEKTLVNGSLAGDMNPAISKMLLTKHGYSDKQETEVNHKNNGGDFKTVECVIVKQP